MATQLTDSMKSALVLAGVGGGMVPVLTHQRTMTGLQARELITASGRLTRAGWERAAKLDARVRIPRADCPNETWHGSAPARADMECAECPKGAATPAAADERLRVAEAKLAQAELDDYQAAVQVIDAKPETAVGTPAGAEASPGRRDRVVRGDVVRIHRGVALYEVLRVETDRALDRTKPGAEPEDFSMAHLAPLDPDSDGRLRWESLDLLHRVPPAARVTTLPVAAHLELAEDFVAVAGPGWNQDLGYLRQPGLVYADGTRVPLGALHQVPLEVLEDGTVVPVGVLKVGDAIVISGRCFTVTWDGDGDPSLIPQRWRDR